MALLRRHFRLFYALALPFSAVDLFLREGMSVAFARALDAIGKTAAVDDVVRSIPFLLAGIGMLMGTFLVGQLQAAGTITLVSSSWSGKLPRSADAVQGVFGRGAPLALTGLLFVCGVFAAIVATLLGGALGVFGLTQLPLPYVDETAIAGAAVGVLAAVVVFIVVTLRWALYPTTVALEGRSGPGALARSSALMAGRGAPLLRSTKARLSLVLLVVFGLAAALQSLFFGPRLIVAKIAGWQFAGQGAPALADMPVWFMIPFALVEVLTNAVVTPLGSILLSLFYFDVRVRFEGLDLDEDEAS